MRSLEGGYDFSPDFPIKRTFFFAFDMVNAKDQVDNADVEADVDVDIDVFDFEWRTRLAGAEKSADC